MEGAAGLEKPEESSKNVIYVQDRPFRALFKYTAIIIVASLALLYAVGFITALLGFQVPYIDSGAIGNQWSSITGGERGDSEWNELERNE